VSDHYARGDWNAVCARCGRKAKASTFVRQWQGYWVCREHSEPRHPQDFVRGKAENPTPPWVQPPPPDNFVKFCTPDGTTAIPGYAIPGCVRPKFIHNLSTYKTGGF